MFINLLNFELRQQFRSGTLIAAAAFFGFAGFMLTMNAVKFPNVYINSPYSIAYHICIVSKGLIFLMTLQCAATLMREIDFRMDGIVYSTPVTKSHYLLTRLLGVLTATFLAFSCFVAGTLLGTMLVNADPSQLGPFHWSHYMVPLMTIALPNAVFCLSVLALLTVSTQNRIVIYLGGLLLFVLYFLAAVYTNAPWIAGSIPADAEKMALAGLIDPLGTSAFMEQSRYWNTVDRNTLTVSLEGTFLYNRMLWTAISIVLMAITWRLYHFRQPRERRPHKTEPATNAPGNSSYVTVPVHEGHNRLAFFSRIRQETAFTIKGLPFLMMLVIWEFVLIMELIPSLQYGIMGSPTYPVTGKILTYILEIVSFFGAVTVIFFSSEMMDRDRSSGFYHILDATPVSNAVLLSSKIAALSIIPFLLITAAILAGMMLQVSAGYYHLEIPVYMSAYYYAGLPLMLIGVLAIFVQTLVTNRYLAMLITAVIVFITGSTVGSIVGFEHPLQLFAERLLVPYSDFIGFGNFGRAFHWRMFYWGSIVFFLIIMIYGGWRRGELSPRARWRRLLLLSRKPTAIIGLLAIAGAGFSATIIQSDINGQFMTRNQQRAWSAAYETTWKPRSIQPQPVISDVDLTVDLYPSQQRYAIAGTYQITNANNHPLTEAFIGLHQDAQLHQIEISGGQMTEIDEKFRHYSLVFDPPLQPAEIRDVHFETSVQRSGFLPINPFNVIIENGSFIRLSRYVPFFGYAEDFELTNPDRRRSYGLPEQSPIAPLVPRQERRADGRANRDINLAMTVTTEAGQTVVATGKQIRNWQEDGRNCFRFQSTKKIPNRYAISSARYANRKTTYRDIEIEVLYHPGHEANAGRILTAAKDALDYCQEHFTPYQYEQLRFAEISSLTDAIGATSYPATLYFVEDRGFLADLRDSTVVDFVYKMVAHETSHQWWGGQMNPRYQEGERLLVETLAAHSESQIYRRAYGEALFYQSLQNEADRYFANRSFTTERPLYKIDGPQNSHVYYHKGALAMAALTHYLGEEAVNRALQKLLHIARSEREPPTSLDLLDGLRNIAADSLRQQIDDWLTKIVIYDLRCDSVKTTHQADGRYRNDIYVSVARFEEDGNGHQVETAIDEWLEIAITSADAESDGTVNDQRMLFKQRMTSGKNHFEIISTSAPAQVIIDPWMLFPDPNHVDNRKSITLTAREQPLEETIIDGK